MAIPSDSSLFDTIFGLPVHPLVVHAAVVLLPVAALGLLVLVSVRPWRVKYRWVTLLGLAAGTAASVAAKESGEELATHVGTPADHAKWGDILPIVAIALFVVATLWTLLQRRTDSSRAQARTAAPTAGPETPIRGAGWSAGLAILTALLALGVLGLTVLVGHSGATAVWAGQLSSSPPPATASTPAPSSATTTMTGPSTGTSSATTTSPATTTGSAVRPTGATSPIPVTGTAASTSFRMDQVAQHAAANSCWAAVSGGVYDLTSWIAEHPGGRDRILGLCGTEATAAFVAQHGTVGRAVTTLARFKIGTLA